MKNIIVLVLILSASIAHSQEAMGFYSLQRDVQILVFKSQSFSKDPESRILGIQDLLRCACVCKHWNAVASMHAIWGLFAQMHFELANIPKAIARHKLARPAHEPNAQPSKALVLLIRKYRIEALNSLESGAPNLEALVELELLGDNSAISSYMSKMMTNNLISGQHAETTPNLKRLASLGSQKAVTFLKNLEEYDDSSEQ